MRSLLSLILFILWAEEEVEEEEEVVEGRQKQEQFKECVANEEGSSFLEICERKIVLVFWKEKENLN